MFEPKGESRYDGKKVLCTVKSVHKEGVYVNIELDGKIANGIISPRCYGVGAERLKALAGIKPDDRVEAVVRSFDPHTRSCSLVLPGFEDLPRLPRRAKRQAVGVMEIAKSPFKPEEAGTTFVFDFANICASLPMRVVPNAKTAIEGRFSDFRANGNASFVGSCKKQGDTSRKLGEADLAILQTVASVEHSVAVSRDRYFDYSAAFGEVVTERVRGFSAVVLPNGGALLTVEGVTEAVIIPPFEGAPGEVAA